MRPNRSHRRVALGRKLLISAQERKREVSSIETRSSDTLAPRACDVIELLNSLLASACLNEVISMASDIMTNSHVSVIEIDYSCSRTFMKNCAGTVPGDGGGSRFCWMVEIPKLS